MPIKITVKIRVFEELELDGWKLRVYETGLIERFKKDKWVKLNQWHHGGYKRCKISGKDYKVHRIVYKAFNPNWDITDTSNDNQIDHVDQTRDNNNIANLRIATHGQNMSNSKAYNNSRTGIRCLSTWYDKKWDSWHWRVQINKDKKKYERSFKAGNGRPPDILPPIPQKVIDARNDMIYIYIYPPTSW